MRHRIFKPTYCNNKIIMLPVLHSLIKYDSGIKTGSRGVCYHNARECVRNRKSKPVALHDRSVLIHPDYNMTFFISPLNRRIVYSKREPFHVLLPVLRHVVPFNDDNCRLMIPFIKGSRARDPLPPAFAIGVFQCSKTTLIGIERMVTRARLPYTKDYLPPGICSLMKPASMTNWLHFPTKSSGSCYNHMEHHSKAKQWHHAETF